MRRKKMIQIAMIACAAVLVTAVAATVSGFLGGSASGYADAGKYTAGETDISAPVSNLDVDWTAGKVILEYHGGNAVELRESSDKAISEDMKMRWWMDGDTLRVRYAKSGLRLNWNLTKELTIRIPKNTAFRDVKICATSAGLMIPALKADTLTLSTTSGAIQAAAEAGRVTADATSGALNLQLSGHADEVHAHTTSGALSVEADDAEALKASSTSGTIHLQGDRVKQCEANATSGKVTVWLNEADRVETGSTSGSVTVRLAKFSLLKANTTSGQISAVLPEQPGFTARLSSVSGRIDYDMPLSHPEDRKEDAYICGDGSAEVELGSTSGNITLNRVDP